MSQTCLLLFIAWKKKDHLKKKINTFSTISAFVGLSLAPVRTWKGRQDWASGDPALLAPVVETSWWWSPGRQVRGRASGIFPLQGPTVGSIGEIHGKRPALAWKPVQRRLEKKNVWNSYTGSEAQHRRPLDWLPSLLRLENNRLNASRLERENEVTVCRTTHFSIGMSLPDCKY